MSTLKKKYKHIFFDLDRTLWDFDRNSSETLRDIISVFKLDTIAPQDGFVKRYNKHNDFVWDLYRQGKMTKKMLRQERFQRTLSDFGLNDPSLINEISEYYIENSPVKGNLIDGAMEVLEYLFPTYTLYIVSNGFLETQIRKLKSSGIFQYFAKIYTSDNIGAAKPNKEFFRHAITASNARINDSIVIGDDYENDFIGAKEFGVDQIWLNVNHTPCEIHPTFEIFTLSEIKNIL